MNNFKNKLKDKYTIIPNELVRNEKISWKAKGIFAYLTSRPESWIFNMKEIANNSTDKKGALQSGIKELEANGYLIRTRFMCPNTGKFKYWQWTVTTPELEDDTDIKNRQSAKPTVGKTDSRQTGSYNKKDLNKKDLIKKEKLSLGEKPPREAASSAENEEKLQKLIEGGSEAVLEYLNS